MQSLKDKDKTLRLFSYSMFTAPILITIISPAHGATIFKNLEGVPPWLIQTWFAINGGVWSIIPGNLVFNVKDYDHPLLNVSKPMSVLDLTVLLTEFDSLMKPCDIKIGRNGEIIEKFPGVLSKVSNG